MPLLFQADAEMSRIIRELAEQRGMGADALVRRALLTYKTLVEAEARGLRGGLVDDRDAVVARLTGI